jgi:MazG family protein
VSERDDLLARVPRGPVPSHLEGQRLLDLVRVMGRLRGPDGCPWDREQTHRSLARHLLEEAHESLQAIDAGDDDALKDELGDLLLQVVFHARIAADDGAWDVDDVAEAIVEKLIRRHPHVFGEVDVSGAEEVLANWERIKAREKGDGGGLEDDIPPTLPALARAAKVLRRADASAFEEWGGASAMEALREELDELERATGERVEDEIGEMLFAAVAVARRLGVDAETALRRTTTAFAARVERFRALARDRGLDPEALSEADARALHRDAGPVPDPPRAAPP